MLTLISSSLPVQVDKYCRPECPCCNLSKRYTQAWLVAIGFIISFGIRCNVGVATVKMSETHLPEFQWTPETVGFVDASFFWGYIVTQVRATTVPVINKNRHIRERRLFCAMIARYVIYLNCVFFFFC